VSNNYFIFQNPFLAVKRIIHGIPIINIHKFFADFLETSYIIKPFTIFVFFSLVISLNFDISTREYVENSTFSKII
jgi:hypothetical protein